MVTLFSIAAAPAAVPMLLGLVYRKATNLSAILGFLSGTAAGLALYAIHKADSPLADSLDAFMARLGLDMEILLFAATAMATLIVMLVVSAIKPSDKATQERIDAFYTRLKTPIGDLPEDQESLQESKAYSPFGVVGISILLIGVLLLAVLPWTRGFALALNGFFAVGLIAIGALLYKLNRKAA